MPTTTPLPVRSRWQAAEVARRYAREGDDARWRSPRRARRDGLLIERALRRYATDADTRSVLDVPCGTGRLASLFDAEQQRYVGVDVSAAMIDQARSTRPGQHAIADATALPFSNASFGTVVACRLLHHIADDTELQRIVAELSRVSSGLVIASFWNARSWQARRPGKRSDARIARPLATLANAFRAAGAEVLGTTCALPLVVQQTFIVARVRAQS